MNRSEPALSIEQFLELLPKHDEYMEQFHDDEKRAVEALHNHIKIEYGQAAFQQAETLLALVDEAHDMNEQLYREKMQKVMQQPSESSDPLEDYYSSSNFAEEMQAMTNTAFQPVFNHLSHEYGFQYAIDFIEKVIGPVEHVHAIERLDGSRFERTTANTFKPN